MPPESAFPTSQQASFFVFKGIDFRTFLAHCDGEDDATIRFMIRAWHKSNELLRKMPPHPNVAPAPTAFVTIKVPEIGPGTVVCGCLQPLFPGGDVGDRVEKSNWAKARLPLALKVR